MQEMFALKGCQINHVKYLELINCRKQAIIFIETLVHSLNITFYGYRNVTIRLRSRVKLILIETTS